MARFYECGVAGSHGAAQEAALQFDIVAPESNDPIWMDVSIDRVFETGREWSREAGAAATALDNLRKTAPVELPEEFYVFYSRSNGGAGELGIRPGWFALWKAEDIVSLNIDYNVATEYPGYFGFGSNGGGELLAFELNAGRCGKVAMVAFIGGEPIVIAHSFSEFVEFVGIRHDAVG